MFAVALFCMGLNVIQAQTVTDIDGNVYKTVTIGKQVWMAENLKTTKYNDGSIIPLITDKYKWAALTTPGYCFYGDNASHKNTDGALYNWYAVKSGKLCPAGWHVPTDEEWTTLLTVLGGDLLAGGKLKEKGTTHWMSPNTGATNSSGFTALPSGLRNPGGLYDYSGIFSSIGMLGYWWSSTKDTSTEAYYCFMLYSSSGVVRGVVNNQFGLSVRCLKDN
jgi:uncharacterized protein (TIGR02145 family)